MSELNRPWMDKYDFDVIKEPDFRTGPLFSLLEDAATRYPSRTALHFKNKVLSYAELNALSCTIAFNLHELGIGKGDKVAVMLPNLPQTVLIYWAILRTGATLVMTNPLYMESELTHLFNDSEAKLLITLDALWPKVKEVYPKTPVKRCIVTTVSEGLAFPLGLLFNLKNRKKKVTIPYDGEHILPWKRLLAGKQTYTCDVIDPEHDLAVLQYTGGTTGTAKACMLTHRNLIINAQQCSHMLCELGRDPNQQECFLGVMPFFHIYGLTVCLNFNTLIAAKMIPFVRYAPQDVLKAIDQHRPTVFPGAPSVYISLLQQKNVADFDLKSIKFCISGSAPMPVEYIEKFQQVTGAVICEGYGLSEASPVTHINPARRTRKNGSIGIPLPGTEAKVVDSDLGGEQLPHGKVGELCVRGPQVMTGYYQREDETADVLRHDWLYTGDIATMDEDGYFYIVDRKKDMIINAGFNIYPREIDEVLYAHPKIAEAVAIGIPHKNRGEMIKVFVVLKQGESMDRAEVIAYCREKLAAYKVPRLVEFRDSLPKTMVGKVLRRALREEELEKKKQKHRKDPKAAPP